MKHMQSCMYAYMYVASVCCLLAPIYVCMHVCSDCSLCLYVPVCTYKCTEVCMQPMFLSVCMCMHVFSYLVDIRRNQRQSDGQPTQRRRYDPHVVQQKHKEHSKECRHANTHNYDNLAEFVLNLKIVEQIYLKQVAYKNDFAMIALSLQQNVYSVHRAIAITSIGLRVRYIEIYSFKRKFKMSFQK